jgi:DNA-binding HxlR family transcriptional regulator
MAHKELHQPSIDTQSAAWQALELVADKWALVVLSVLACGKQRHGQLQRAIKGISAKMLTQTLRRLERDGLVARKVYPVVPPRVEYALTPLGQTVIEPLDAMCHWANTHWYEVLAARSAYQSELDAREDED